MIRYIRGEYLYYDKGAIVICTESGLGLRVFVPDTSTLLNKREGDIVTAYTYMQVKEDGMSLYGFQDREALALFEMLITVNGVGPKAGLAIMSIGTPNQIKSYIVSKDSKSIAKAQGVGKKTAERVILELCDKVSALPIEGVEAVDLVQAPAAFTDDKLEAIIALTTLGYSKQEAESAIGSIAEDGLTVEEYIKKSLKYLL